MFEIATEINYVLYVFMQSFHSVKHMSTWSVSLQFIAYHEVSWDHSCTAWRVAHLLLDAGAKTEDSHVPRLTFPPDTQPSHCRCQIPCCGMLFPRARKQNTKWKSGVSSLYPSNGQFFFPMHMFAKQCIWTWKCRNWENMIVLTNYAHIGGVNLQSSGSWNSNAALNHITMKPSFKCFATWFHAIKNLEYIVHMFKPSPMLTCFSVSCQTDANMQILINKKSYNFEANLGLFATPFWIIIAVKWFAFGNCNVNPASDLSRFTFVLYGNQNWNFTTAKMQWCWFHWNEMCSIYAYFFTRVQCTSNDIHHVCK